MWFEQHLYRFDYGSALGLFDFSDEQYFSWSRAERVLVRGERGEIRNDEVVYLLDASTPIHLNMLRHQEGIEGNLSEPALRGIQVGESWVYRNPFTPARLMDDEIAVAACLTGMADYIRTGSDFYSLGEACQDHYLYLLAQQSVAQGVPVKATRQVWAS